MTEHAAAGTPATADPTKGLSRQQRDVLRAIHQLHQLPGERLTYEGRVAEHDATIPDLIVAVYGYAPRPTTRRTARGTIASCNQCFRPEPGYTPPGDADLNSARASIARTLRRLEARGLVRRGPGGADYIANG